MGLFRKSRDSSPDIIYTQEFRIANGAKYLDYMERKEALSPENANDLQRDKNMQNDPDVPKNYKGYLGYTDRKAATKMETDLSENEKGDYPTFMQGVYELNESQHKQLVANLRKAQKNKSLLWAGVISFSPEFIEKSGLMNKDGSVNQKAIKTAVMNAMPDYLRAEGMNNAQTFWWGDIHLNTNHVHVHLAISQKRNTRPLKANGEPKGMFHTKSIRRLKSLVHHELANTKSRTRQLSLEKSLDYRRGEMIDEINQVVSEPQNKELRRLVVNLQQTLPNYKDKRRWRASNRSVGFRESRELAFDLVDYLLKNQLSSLYQQYQANNQELDDLSRQAYGQNIKDTIKSRDDKLRERLANSIFSNLREYQYLLGTSKKLYKKDSLAILKVQGPELNKKIMKAEELALKRLDSETSQAKQLRMRLGLRRYYLKITNLDQKIARLQKKIDGLEGLGNRTEFAEFKKFYKEKQLMYKLQKLPHRSLNDSPELKQLLKKLQNKYIEAEKINIKKISPELVELRLNQVQREKELLKNHKDDPGLFYIMDGPAQGIDQYEREEQILKLKIQIYKNNSLPEIERRKLNGPLFQKLKQLYRKENGTSGTQKIRSDNRTEKKDLNTSTFKGPIRINKLVYSLSGLLNSTNNDDRRAIRALHKRLDDDEIEREDELEQRYEKAH